MTLARRLAAEAVGTGMLLATVIGSGIMGERLAGGNTAIALLANTLATGTGLAVYILIFHPVSGAHFNPLVTLAEALHRRLAWRATAAYIGAQLAGAFAGVAVANLMFGEPLFSVAQQARAGTAQVWSEFVASFGLLSVIFGATRAQTAAVPYAIGAYIAAAYWFTASTCFANPAVTLARAASDSFAGIRPQDVPGFMLGQLLGAGTAILFWRWLVPAKDRTSGR